MKFSDLLGEQQPDEGDDLAPAAPTRAEPIGVFSAEPTLPAAAPDLPPPPPVEAAPPPPMGQTAHLAAVNVAPVVPPVADVPADDGERVAALGIFDDDLLPSARTRRTRR